VTVRPELREIATEGENMQNRHFLATATGTLALTLGGCVPQDRFSMPRKRLETEFGVISYAFRE
jgi:hypothetical protein